MESVAEQPGSVPILDLIRPPHGGPCARNAVSGWLCPLKLITGIHTERNIQTETQTEAEICNRLKIWKYTPWERGLAWDLAPIVCFLLAFMPHIWKIKENGLSRNKF